MRLLIQSCRNTTIATRRRSDRIAVLRLLDYICEYRFIITAAAVPDLLHLAIVSPLLPAGLHGDRVLSSISISRAYCNNADNDGVMKLNE